jgi:hypothetical protein
MLAQRARIARVKKRQRRHVSDEESSHKRREPAPIVSGVGMHDPSNVVALQRTIGNQATIQLLRANANMLQRDDDDAPAPLVIPKFRKTVVDDTNTLSEPDFRKIKSGKVKDNDKKGGLYLGYKKGKKIKGATQSIIENSTETTVTALPPDEYAEQFHSAAGTVASAATSGSILGLQAALSGMAGMIMPYFKLVKLAIAIPKAIYKTHKTRKNLMALKEAYKAAKPKAEEGSVRGQQVYDSAKYGYKKVSRQLAERITTIIIKIAKLAMIITDLVTGGTAVLFTSIGKLMTGTAQGVMATVAALKSLYKSSKGTKGVARKENAETLIMAAFKRSPEALHLLYKLKIGKRVYWKQQGYVQNKNFAKGAMQQLKNEEPEFKMPEQDYYDWLATLSAKEWGRMREELAGKMKSTIQKSFTAKYGKYVK